MNNANYFLTKDGVISKLDTYWDRLRDLSIKLEGISKHMVRKLFNSYTGSALLMIVIFWLDMEKSFSLTLLALVVLGSISLIATQVLSYLEFMGLQRKGMIIHDELNQEIEFGFDEDLEEDISVEERILLSNFLLACELPINRILYIALLLVLPLANIACLAFYYFYW